MFITTPVPGISCAHYLLFWLLRRSTWQQQINEGRFCCNSQFLWYRSSSDQGRNSFAGGRCNNPQPGENCERWCSTHFFSISFSLLLPFPHTFLLQLEWNTMPTLRLDLPTLIYQSILKTLQKLASIWFKTPSRYLSKLIITNTLPTWEWAKLQTYLWSYFY